jgi:hypothetical protein
MLAEHFWRSSILGSRAFLEVVSYFRPNASVKIWGNRISSSFTDVVLRIFVHFLGDFCAISAAARLPV